MLALVGWTAIVLHQTVYVPDPCMPRSTKRRSNGFHRYTRAAPTSQRESVAFQLSVLTLAYSVLAASPQIASLVNRGELAGNVIPALNVRHTGVAARASSVTTMPRASSIAA